jgi:hypothetical protein
MNPPLRINTSFFFNLTLVLISSNSSVGDLVAILQSVLTLFRAA